MSEGMFPLAEWASFYVIVGSSAAALTGLQFVVMTRKRDDLRSPKGLESRPMRSTTGHKGSRPPRGSAGAR